MDKNRYLNSAWCFKLFFSAFFVVLGLESVVAQNYDRSIFVVDSTVSPSAVVQAWVNTPVQFEVQDTFYSPSLARYLGQNGTETFAATANLVSGGTVVYSQGLGNLAFNANGFSFVLGANGTLMPSVLKNQNIILHLVLPSETATFAMTSLPYAIHARVAERGLAGSLSAVSGNFISTFSVQTGLVVTQNKLVVRGSRVGFGTFSPAYTVDVAGVANFSDMYLSGVPLTESLSWRKSTLASANIYTTKFPVGIRTAFPDSDFSVHVAATVNATNLTRNGNPITASNFWSQTTNPTFNLYILDHEVGIGRATPQEALDVKGGILMDTTSSENTGTIRWASVGAFKDFQGYLETVEEGIPTQTWRSLTGISGTGRSDRVAKWNGPVSPPSLGSVTELIHKSGIGLGIGATPTSRLQVAGTSSGSVFLVSSSANIPLLHVSPTGSLGIGTTIAGHAVEVVGTINAQDLLVNGVPLRLTLSSGTYWLRNSQNALYYMHGNVGIGRPDPTSLFEIAAPNRFETEVTKNPAVTFTAAYGTAEQQRYTLGIDAQQDGVFRVEKGTDLGSETPLFVAYEDRFGVGLANPKANLHVSGNTGLILTGKFQAFDVGVGQITSTVSATGAGTRMVYHPAKGIFRVGNLSGTDTYQGTQWNDANLGIVTTAFGRDHLVSGNFSHAIGGIGHSVGGAYATVLGGQTSSAYGDFTVAMGRGAAANNHGSFVWGDSVGGTFMAATQNQFLIRAAGGVGINTSATGLQIQLSTKNVSLTVYPKPVGPVHFLGILTDPTDWASASAIVDGLKTQGYLTASGEMAAGFNPDAVLSFPSDFAYAHLEPQIRAVLALRDQDLVLNMTNGTDQKFLYTQRGGLGINTTTPTDNALIVMAPFYVNATGNAQLVVQGTSAGAPLFLTVGTENPSTSPSFVVVASGNVGVGKFPDLLVNGQEVVSSADPAYGYLDSAGAIVAEAFIFPDGQTLSASESVLVWSYVNTTPNIYFPSANLNASGRIAAVGNVGIGTTSPNSLLEISNRSNLQSLTGTLVSPVITFDLDGTDFYTFGVPRTETDVFRIGTGGESSLGSGSAFAVLDTRVGIAITRPLSSALSVGGNSLMSRLQIGTANLSSTTNLAVRSVNATKFLVNNQIIDWLAIPTLNRTDLFYDTSFDPNAIPPIYSYVGIGTTAPIYAVDIAGTINIVSSANMPDIVAENLIVEGDYYATKLVLRDAPAGSLADLEVTNKELVLDTDGSVINISKVFTRGEGAGGYVGMWSIDAGVPSFSVLAQTNMYWTSPTADMAGIFLVTANTTQGRYQLYSDSFSASNNVNIGSGELSNMLAVQSVASHDGVLAHSRSHDATSINMLIQTWPEYGADWFGSDAPQDLTGLSIRMANVPYNNAPTYFSSKAKAIGLQVDVSNVSLQQFTDEGYRFPAIFMGADNQIGIGGTPNATLDVYGTLRAQTFQISEGLTISTINVLNAIYVNAPGKVGFGTESPKTALDINGSIQSVGMVAPVLAQTLSAGGTLTVGTNGYVGMGISNPTAQWMLQKQFQSLPSSDFTFQVIDATIEDNNVAKPLIGAHVVLSSVSGNNYASQLGDVFGVKKVVGTGYKVDMSGLNVPTGGVIVGMSSTVSTNRDSDRKAAIFLGGNVGIGTSMPTYPLEVAGTIYATNAPAASFLTEQEVASFSMLNVANNLKVTQSGQFWDLSVNTLRQTNLRLEGTLSIPDQSLVVANQLLAQSFVSINETITVNAVRVASSAGLHTVSVNSMAVGGVLSSEVLRVYGDFLTNNLDMTSGELQVPLVSVNDQTFVVTDTTRVGIGTSTPSSKLHLKTTPYTVNSSVQQMSASDYRTWNPLILQASATTVGEAVGMVFVPDFDESGQSGAGVVGIKTAVGDTSSALAFITDPEGEEAYPVERLRITDAGGVGIGTTAPTSLLHVNGTTFANAWTLPTASMYVDNMAGTTVTFSITTNITPLLDLSYLRLTHLDMAPSGMPVVSSSNGQLFVDSATQELFYAVEENGETILGNLTVTSSVVPDSLPYFNAGRSIAGTNFMKWATENTGIFRITTTNSQVYAAGSRVAVMGYVTQNVTAAKTLQTISLGFKDRTSPGTGRFSGLDVSLSAGDSYVADRFVGLSVGVSSNLRTQTTLANGTVVSGSIIAAAFLAGTETSGNVGIVSGSDSDMVPSASLHILAAQTNHAPLWVQTTANSVLTDALFVSSNTYVGLGTSAPSARLSVAAQGTDSGMRLFSASHAPLMSVTNTGVGIGVSQPTGALSVAGTLYAPTAVFGGVSASVLSVNTANTGVAVSALGEVMFGTSTPLGQFTMLRQFTSPSAMPARFPMQDIRQDLSVATNADLTGVALVVSTDASSIFEGSTGSKLARGMVLDLTDLVAITGNPVIGTYVNMGSGVTAGASRYAATFLGGNVGMGVSQPTVALDIAGDIRAGSLIASGGDWTLSAITTNVFASGSAVMTSLNIQNTNEISLEVLGMLGIDGNAAVSIEGIQDANQFDAMVLHATLGTANVVFVGADSGFTSGTVLGVDGNGTLESLTVTTVNVGVSILGDSLAINSPVFVSANRVSHAGSIQADYLRMDPSPTQNANYAPYATLFVQDQLLPADQALIFRNLTTGVTANLSAALRGLSNRVAGYNADQRISDQPFISYRLSEASGVTYSVLSVGTANGTLADDSAVLDLHTGYGVSQNLGAVYASRVSVGMGPRITASSNVFTGVGIALMGQGGAQDMADGEVVGGLYVDMTDSLVASTVLPNGDSVVGTKIAAIFRAGTQTSGNVGINTDETWTGTFVPSANLHMLSALTDPIRIETSGRTAVGSDTRGYLAIGESVPSAKLAVTGYDDTDAFALFAGTSRLMTGGDSGVAVGQLPNDADWSVAGSVSANQAVLGGLAASSLQVGSSMVINSDGYLGVGTLAADQAVTLVQNIALPSQLTRPYTQRIVSLNIDKAGPVFSPLIGYGMSIAADGVSGQFGAGIADVSAVGISVDLTDLQAGTKGVVHGVHVLMGSDDFSVSRNPLILTGGNVGIGSTSPLSALQVVGTVTGRHAFIDNVSVNATSATFNRLTLSGGASEWEQMTITAPGVDLEVLGTLRFANTTGVTLNFQDNLSDSKVWSSDGIIADVATFNTLFIPEKAAGLSSSLSLWVSGNALLRHNLTVSPRENRIFQVNTVTATGNMFLPTVNIADNTPLSLVGDLAVGKGVYLLPSTYVSAEGMGSLVLLNDTLDTTLQVPYYKYTSGSIVRDIPLIRIFEAYRVTPTTLNMVMYDSSGIVAKSTGLFWSADTATGDHVYVDSDMVAASKYSFGLISSLNTTALTSDYSANKITMAFGDRTGGGAYRFMGSHVFLDGNVPNGEKAVGVRVDLQQLLSESSTLLPLNEDLAVDGFKSSAVFLAENNGDTTGTLGIFTFTDSAESATPDATLHVGSDVTANIGSLMLGVVATQNALIVTSNVGLWVASQDVQLQNTRLLVHATETIGFLASNAAKSPVLTALQTGSVGIGSTAAIASLNVVHAESTGYALWMENPVTSNPFVVTGAGRTGLGNTNPTSVLDMTFDPDQYTFSVPVTWRVTAHIPDGLSTRYTLTGTYEIGGASYVYGVVPRTDQIDATPVPIGSVWAGGTTGPESATNVSSTTGGYAPLRVSSANVVSMVVGQEGNLGIWRRSSTENYMAMAVSGSMTVGYDATWSAPSWLENPVHPPVPYPQLQGYAVRQSGDFAFLGYYRESQAVSGNAVIMWGKDDGDVLSVKDVNQTELLHFTKTRMGVATSDPQANLSIGATAITQYPFRVSAVASPNALTMDTAGNVGLGTLVPSQNLHVMGDFVINAGADAGVLHAGTVTSNYMPLQALTFGVGYETAPEFKGTLPIHQVGMTLSAYATQNITGLGYRLTSGNAYTSVLVNANSAAVAVDGLIVDVTDLSIEEYSTNEYGYKAAAAFMGGPMVVGYATVGGTSVISTSDITFQAYAMDADGRRITTGDILYATTEKNGVTGRRIHLHYLGNRDVYHEVTPLDFTAIQAIADETSAAMLDTLIAAGDLVVTRDTLYATRSGSVATTNVNVKDILNQAKTKASVVFQVERDGTNQDSLLYLLSGQNASTVTTSMVSAVGVGHVGIGFPSGFRQLEAIDRPFVVSGDVQLGVTVNNFSTSAAGWGSKTYFSGGRIYDPEGTNDNTHEYFMGRYNVSSGVSELRMNIGETSTTSPNPSSKLIVDTYPAGGSVAQELDAWGNYFRTGFTVSIFGYVDPSDDTVLVDLPVHAGVGIGTTSPEAGLHVVRRSPADGGPSMAGITTQTPFSHTVLIESKVSSQNLALVNYGTSTDSNFMTFIHKDTTQLSVQDYAPTVLGSIEMDGFGGVQFSSPEADYAEYLPKASQETLRPGDVVGVFNGQVSRATVGARSVKVISSRPIVSGNFPGQAQLDAFGLVAFMGQVPVRVRGPVRAGNYLIPSGLQDGTAVAVVASVVVNPEQIIGQAWTSSEAEGEGMVNAIVGMSFANKHVGERLGEVATLRDEVGTIKSELAQLESYLQKKYEERQAKIAALRKR